ncbi:hypothetical protein TNCV_4428961 [Trichonephila clavipes]|nr:hypothetical protein TNCV_4428961 [Trichonephila clavipes]
MAFTRGIYLPDRQEFEARSLCAKVGSGEPNTFTAPGKFVHPPQGEGPFPFVFDPGSETYHWSIAYSFDELREKFA